MSTARWEGLGADFSRRVYSSYADYLTHQRAKLDRWGPDRLAKHDATYIAALRPRLEADGLRAGVSVLCLGSRDGAEVRLFRALGCEAIGIDVNPGPDNPDVILGDFHRLLYAGHSQHVIYTNALDHCYDLTRCLDEVFRVLVPDGRFIVEAVRGTQEGCAAGAYESLTWTTIDKLIATIESHRFTLRRRKDFDTPWPGAHLVFRSLGDAA